MDRAVKAFCKTILLGLTFLDVSQFDLMITAPINELASDQFRPIVRSLDVDHLLQYVVTTTIKRS